MKIVIKDNKLINVIENDKIHNWYIHQGTFTIECYILFSQLYQSVNQTINHKAY